MSYLSCFLDLPCFPNVSIYPLCDIHHVLLRDPLVEIFARLIQDVDTHVQFEVLD